MKNIWATIYQTDSASLANWNILWVNVAERYCCHPLRSEFSPQQQRHLFLPSPHSCALCCQVAAELAKVGGVSKLLVAEDAALEGALAERVAPVLLAAHEQFKFSHIVGGYL